MVLRTCIPLFTTFTSAQRRSHSCQVCWPSSSRTCLGAPMARHTDPRSRSSSCYPWLHPLNPSPFPYQMTDSAVIMLDEAWKHRVHLVGCNFLTHMVFPGKFYGRTFGQVLGFLEADICWPSSEFASFVEDTDSDESFGSPSSPASTATFSGKVIASRTCIRPTKLHHETHRLQGVASISTRLLGRTWDQVSGGVDLTPSEIDDFNNKPCISLHHILPGTDE